ncbi:MAG: glycosyltransferase [Acidobacteriota bacterium]
MVAKVPRVAFFPDSYLEVNGVAMTSNKLTGFVRRRGYPFLCVYSGKKTEVRQDGNITFVTLKQSPISFRMDEGLKYDPLFQRHTSFLQKELENFRPDVFHITGLNDVSIMGAYLAWKMDVALVGSWHTNLHEYAARRLRTKFSFLPKKFVNSFTDLLERKILDGAKLYYQMPQILLAPNQELIEMLAEGTRRSVHLMIRGVDTEVFSADKRTVDDNILRFGFVGRLRSEKNVRLLADLEKALLKAGKNNFKFLIVGEGDERAYLEKNMQTAELTGFLEGEQLSEAYANMDVFVFPSETDAYGNVPQEAMASSVPAIVTDKGGPKSFVRHGETGFIAENLEEFVKYSIELIDNPEKLAEMKKLSREFALSRSWDSVFETVYQAYAEAKVFLDGKKKLRKNVKSKKAKVKRQK